MNDTIIAYEIVTGWDGPAAVALRVRRMMELGWEPMGGVTSAWDPKATNGEFLFLAQAMVKRDKKPEA